MIGSLVAVAYCPVKYRTARITGHTGGDDRCLVANERGSRARGSQIYRISTLQEGNRDPAVNDYFRYVPIQAEAGQSCDSLDGEAARGCSRSIWSTYRRRRRRLHARSLLGV
jgi:hypothetical protein